MKENNVETHNQINEDENNKNNINFKNLYS